MSLEDYESELTELSSDEEEPPVPLKSTVKTRKSPRKVTTKEKEIELPNILKPPRQTNYSTRALFDMMNKEVVDLNPHYQRDVVWSEEKQVALIGSIFMNIAIPPIMFSSTEESWKEAKTCMDGKQRLTSIRRFVNGEIYFKHPTTGKKIWYSRPLKGRRAALSPNQRSVFDNKQITCIEYDSLSERQQRDIFQRVQNGVALTAAERLRATSGPRADLVRRILVHELGDSDFFRTVSWGKGSDFHTISFSVWLRDHYPAAPQVVGIPFLEKWLQEPCPIREELQETILETFRIVKILAEDSEFRNCFDKIPQIPFSFAVLLVHRNKRRLSLTQLSSAIAGSRAALGRGQGEQRATLKAVKALDQFIKTLNPRQLSSDGKGDVPAVEAIKAHARASSSREPSSAPRPPKTTTKRKREAVDTDDEDDKPLMKSKAASRARTKSESTSVAKPQAAKGSTARSSLSVNVTPKPPQTAPKKTPISCLPRIQKKSSSTNVQSEPSSAATRVRRKSTQQVPIPTIQIATSSATKFDIPTTLPAVEIESIARAPSAESRPSTASARDSDTSGWNRASPSRPQSSRLESMRQAKAKAGFSNHMHRMSPTEGSPVLPTHTPSTTPPAYFSGTHAPTERVMGEPSVPRGPASDPRYRSTQDSPFTSPFVESAVRDPRLAIDTSNSRRASYDSPTISPTTQPLNHFPPTQGMPQATLSPTSPIPQQSPMLPLGHQPPPRTGFSPSSAPSSFPSGFHPPISHLSNSYLRDIPRQS